MLVAAVAGAGVLVTAGCSGRSSFLSGGPTVGQLKTSLGHLEYENAQLKRDLAKLQRDNRSIEDRLVQEERDNGDLAARLDNARNLLRGRGLDPDTRLGDRRDGRRDPQDEGDGARTIPAGQSTKKRRKQPFARIPGQVTPARPDSDQDEEAAGASGSGTSADDDSTSGRSNLDLDDNLDHHTFYTGPLPWTPVAGGTGDPPARIR